MARQQKSGHQLNSLAAALGGMLPRHNDYLRPVHLTEKKVYSTTYADPPKCRAPCEAKVRAARGQDYFQSELPIISRHCLAACPLKHSADKLAGHAALRK